MSNLDQTLRLIRRSYYGVWATIHRAKRKAGLDPKIQSCHGFRKYFENALDDANIDHEKKMVVEGHFAGTRARHYTNRDVKELRALYNKAYPFIALYPDAGNDNSNPPDWRNRLAGIESRLARQNVLEARLLVLEDELNQLKASRKD